MGDLPATTIEIHYTINDLADVLNMSVERVRQLVMHEPGVLVFSPSKPSTGRKRTRNSYRIPARVVQRILRRCANPTAA